MSTWGNAPVTPETARILRVSVVLPIFNERENLGPLLNEIAEALKHVAHEVVAVDDASTDGSDRELEQLAANSDTVQIIRLGRPSGQSAALAAGFERARACLIATLDADGQNDPADLVSLLAAVEDGEADAAIGVRVRRQDSRWKRLQGSIANRARDLITGDVVRDTGCGVRVMRAQFARRLPRFKGMHRFIPTLLRREGARVIEREVAHRPRLYGKTKYGMWDRVFVGLWDAVGVRWLLRRRLPVQLVEDTRNDQ
jgi:glycosyltransferase involved in cell wall biosynthesis